MIAYWTNALSAAGLLVIYALTSCLGLYLIKVAEAVKSQTFLLGLILYVVGAAIWMIILRLLPLSLAFPIAAGVLVIGTMLTGAVFLSENVTAWQIAGAVMIMAGITLMAMGR